jgi:hypothetical protein
MVGAGCRRERPFGRAGDSCDHGGARPNRKLNGGMAHRARATSDQDSLAGERTGMQPLGPVL